MNNSRECQIQRARWLVVLLFAIAMAWAEAATVFYLRTLVGRIEPYQPRPIPLADSLDGAERVREAATLMMLLAIGWLTGQTWRSRLAYTLIAFGAWDIFYYVFLKVLTGWPKSLLDWDVLFLLPLPWWGPVLAPMCIALLMVVWGTLVTQFERLAHPICSNWRIQFSCGSGVALALYVFMADALRVADGGNEALRNMLPVSFNWPLFVVALLLMAAPIFDVARQIWRQQPMPLARTVAP